MGKWILMWYVLQSKLTMLLKQVSCLKKGGSMSKGPDIISLIHFCQSRGVYLAPGPLTIFRVSVTSSYKCKLDTRSFQIYTKISLGKFG